MNKFEWIVSWLHLFFFSLSIFLFFFFLNQIHKVDLRLYKMIAVEWIKLKAINIIVMFYWMFTIIIVIAYLLRYTEIAFGTSTRLFMSLSLLLYLFNLCFLFRFYFFYIPILNEMKNIENIRKNKIKIF